MSVQGEGDMFSRRAAIFVVTLSAIVVAGCASGPQVRTDADPSVNLASYKTFGFFDNLATDKSQYTTMLTSRLKAATQREMEKRGYRLATSNPELLINFNVNVADRTKVESTPSMGGYYGYRRGMYGMWGGYPQDVHTTNYQEGTLAIDLVDAAKKQLVWHGVAQGKISSKARENPGPAIDNVVTQIFAKHPVPAQTS